MTLEQREESLLDQNPAPTAGPDAESHVSGHLDETVAEQKTGHVGGRSDRDVVDVVTGVVEPEREAELLRGRLAQLHSAHLALF